MIFINLRIYNQGLIVEVQIVCGKTKDYQVA
jgi:hypothetical protein